MKLQKTWETKIEGIREGNTKKPIIYKDTALFAFSFRSKSFYKSKLLAISTEDNSILWQKDLEHIITPLLPHPTTQSILVTTMGGEILYIDIISGKEIWKTSVELDHCNLFGAKGIVNDIAIIPETAGNSKKIYGVNIRNGHISWEYSAGDSLKYTQTALA